MAALGTAAESASAVGDVDEHELAREMRALAQTVTDMHAENRAAQTEWRRTIDQKLDVVRADIHALQLSVQADVGSLTSRLMLHEASGHPATKAILDAHETRLDAHDGMLQALQADATTREKANDGHRVKMALGIGLFGTLMGAFIQAAGNTLQALAQLFDTLTKRGS